MEESRTTCTYDDEIDMRGCFRKLNLIGANVFVILVARPHEEPVKPNTMLNIAIAAILGLMLAIFGVFFQEYMKEE